jgi:TolB protein
MFCLAGHWWDGLNAKKSGMAWVAAVKRVWQNSGPMCHLRPQSLLAIAALMAAILNGINGVAASGRLEWHGSLPWASPDGKRITFESNRDAPNLQIYVMDVNGSDVRRLTHSSTNDLGPVWSADGKWIVFRSFRGDSVQLEAIRPDGSERYVASDHKDIGWPRISSNGKRVGFQSSDEAGAKTIVTMNLDGSDLRIVPTGLDRPWDPVWSPDGTQLVFAQQPPDAGDPTAQTESVYISDTSGHNRRLLATFPGFIQLPAWSPDGKTIAYQTWTGKRGDADIVLLDVASGRFTTITHRERPYLDETPAWLPDGRLLFQSTRDGRYEIYVMNADGSSQQRLTK